MAPGCNSGLLTGAAFDKVQSLTALPFTIEAMTPLVAGEIFSFCYKCSTAS